MNVLFKIITLSLFLTGCHSSKKNIVITEITGSPGFRSSVFLSLRKIENNLGKALFFKKGMIPISINEGIIPQSINEINETEDDELIGLARMYPKINHNACHITILKKEWESDYSRDLVLLHEIGHCFGLDHPITDFGSVMDSNTTDDKMEIFQARDIPNFLEQIAKLSVPLELDDALIFLHPQLNLFQPFEQSPFKPDF